MQGTNATSALVQVIESAGSDSETPGNSQSRQDVEEQTLMRRPRRPLQPGSPSEAAVLFTAEGPQHTEHATLFGKLRALSNSKIEDLDI